MSDLFAKTRRLPLGALAAALGFAGVALAVFPPGLNPFGPVKLMVTLLCAACACFALALDPVARGRVTRMGGLRILLAAGALALLGVLSLVTALDVRLAVLGGYPGYTGLVTAVVWLALGVVAAAASPAEARRVVGRAAVLSILVVGAYALLQRLGVDPMPASDAFSSGRATSTLGNAANLGVFLALALPLALDRTLAEATSRWRMLAWTSLALGAAAAGLSGSRGAWVGIAAGVVVFGLGAARDTRRSALWALGAVTAVVVVAIVASPVSAERAIGGGTGEATALGRLAVWRSSVPMVAERPFLGWGPSGYGRAHLAFATPAEVDPRGRVEALDDPHNLFLSTATAVGVPGLVALLALVWASGAALWHRRDAPERSWVVALAASLGGGLLALQFHFVTLDTGAMLAVLLGMTAGVELEAEESLRERGRAPWSAAAAVFVLLALGAGGLTLADAHIRRGFMAAERGEWSQAVRAFDVARSLAPWEPAIEWAAGRAATDAVASDPTAVLTGAASFQAAAARMPGDPRPLRDLGDLYIASAVATGDSWPVALGAYDEALALSPTDPRAWLGRGVALAGLGDLVGASESIERALTLAPRFAGAWENLASVYDAAGNAEAAAEARERAQSAR